MDEVAMGAKFDFYTSDDTSFEVTTAVRDGQRPLLYGDMPVGFEDLVHRCWNKDASKRPTAEDAAAILWSMLHDIRIDSAPLNGVSRTEGLPFQQFRRHLYRPGIVTPANNSSRFVRTDPNSELYVYMLSLVGGSWLLAPSAVSGFELEAVDAVAADVSLIQQFEARLRRMSHARGSLQEYFNADTSKFNADQLRVLALLRERFHKHLPGSSKTDAHTIYVFHGPRREHVDSICNHGLVATSALDAGYFGAPGLYTTFNVEYAVRYAFGDYDKTNPRPPATDGLYPVIMFAGAVSMAYPITPAEDYEVDETGKRAPFSKYFGKPLKRGFDCHVACVSDANEGQAVNSEECQYVEIVMDQEAQLVPLAVLWFRKVW
jgi:hypothetical protein